MHESYPYLVRNPDGSVASSGRAVFVGWKMHCAKFTFNPPVTLTSSQILEVASMVVQYKKEDGS